MSEWNDSGDDTMDDGKLCNVVVGREGDWMAGVYETNRQDKMTRTRRVMSRRKMNNRDSGID